MIITVKDADKGEAIEIARRFEKLGYIIYATRSTAAALKEAGIKARKVNKINQESPTVMDLILGHRIDLVIDTPTRAGINPGMVSSSAEPPLKRALTASPAWIPREPLWEAWRQKVKNCR